MPTDKTPELTPEQLAEIERKFDPETAFRQTGKTLGFLIALILVLMSVYHFYASGFGLVRELVHRGIHLSFVLGLVFLLFGARKTSNKLYPKAWYRFDGVPLIDIVFSFLAITAAMYLPLLPASALAQRVGNPSQFDVFMGSALLILTLEAARRSVGPTLPIIGLIFIGFAYFGPLMPGALKHGGSSWLGIVNHLYMTNQGIYGIAIGVMAQYVFLFILFGVLATRIGLGQLFIDMAMVIAGRYSGGPAKVAILASGFFGMLSGSPTSNVITSGSLTIPAMKKAGYSGRYAAAIEACASTGGVLMPPVMGTVAFIMASFLNLPYAEILLAALIPGMIFYIALIIQTDLYAAKNQLKGMNEQDIPKLLPTLLKILWFALEALPPPSRYKAPNQYSDRQYCLLRPDAFPPHLSADESLTGAARLANDPAPVAAELPRLPVDQCSGL